MPNLDNIDELLDHMDIFKKLKFIQEKIKLLNKTFTDPKLIKLQNKTSSILAKNNKTIQNMNKGLMLIGKKIMNNLNSDEDVENEAGVNKKNKANANTFNLGAAMDLLLSNKESLSKQLDELESMDSSSLSSTAKKKPPSILSAFSDSKLLELMSVVKNKKPSGKSDKTPTLNLANKSPLNINAKSKEKEPAQSSNKKQKPIKADKDETDKDNQQSTSKDADNLDLLSEQDWIKALDTLSDELVQSESQMKKEDTSQQHEPFAKAGNTLSGSLASLANERIMAANANANAQKSELYNGGSVSGQQINGGADQPQSNSTGMAHSRSYVR
jgi:hypothetical protein